MLEIAVAAILGMAAQVLYILQNTPKNRANLSEGSVGDDRWDMVGPFYDIQ